MHQIPCILVGTVEYKAVGRWLGVTPIIPTRLHICSPRKFKFSQIVVDSSTNRRYLDSLVRIVSSIYVPLAAALGRSIAAAGAGDTCAARPPLKRRRYGRCAASP